MEGEAEDTNQPGPFPRDTVSSMSSDTRIEESVQIATIIIPVALSYSPSYEDSEVCSCGSRIHVRGGTVIV